jgi:hypothetical protein
MDEEEEEEEEIEQGELETYEQSEQRYEEVQVKNRCCLLAAIQAQLGILTVLVVQHQPIEPLWRTWDQLAQKSGPHHTVYWAKPCGSTYKGGWDDNRKSGSLERATSPRLVITALAGRWQCPWMHRSWNSDLGQRIRLRGGMERQQATRQRLVVDEERREAHPAVPRRFPGEQEACTLHAHLVVACLHGTQKRPDWAEQSTQSSRILESSVCVPWQGFGVYMFPNGEKYEGEWTAGLRGADPRRPFVSSRCAARVRRRTRGAIPDRALLEGVASRSTRTATSTTESGPKASGPARAFCTKVRP